MKNRREKEQLQLQLCKQTKKRRIMCYVSMTPTPLHHAKQEEKEINVRRKVL
jgi:hypothetical protein